MFEAYLSSGVKRLNFASTHSHRSCSRPNVTVGTHHPTGVQAKTGFQRTALASGLGLGLTNFRRVKPRVTVILIYFLPETGFLD